MKDLQLGGKKLTAAKDAVRDGRYQLLLGAGASSGAVTSAGAVPMGRELVRILAQRFPKAPIDEHDSLPRAYQRAVWVSTPEKVWETFKQIFGGCSHANWHRHMASLPWRRVWTLNVDDSFENSFRDAERTLSRRLQSISWDDEYTETGDLQVVHLHGHIIGSEPRRLVFSFSEYQSAAATHPVWHQILAGVISVEPFIILGARLLDDPDIESTLMNNTHTASAPSFVVDPYIDAGNRWELERLGFTVCSISAEDFIESWTHTLGLTDDVLTALDSSEALSIPQLTRLQTNFVPPPPRDHDFFGGDAPVWNDIVANRAALMDWMKTTIEDLERWLGGATRRPHLQIIYGERLSGASSGLFVVAREAVRQNARVFLFDKSSRWNVGSLLSAMRRQGPTLILIDGGADFADDIDETLSRAESENVELCIAVTEVPRNDLRLEGRLSGHYEKESTHIPRWLSKADARSVMLKLKDFGRLGTLELRDDAARTRHFAGRDIFAAMMDVEYAMGFRKRLDSEVKAISESWQRELLLLLALAAQAGRPVGLVDACVAVDVPSDVLAEELQRNEHLSALIERVDDRIAARQRDRSLESLLRVMNASKALDSVLVMIRRLAPLASRQSLTRRNRVPLLVSHLMSCRNLLETFAGCDLDPFYEELRETFGDWNGRYWEQRAIHAKAQHAWARAESFAARAVGLYDDAFTRTTYGTILLNKCEDLAHGRDSAWLGFYKRGCEQFDIAHDYEPNNRVTAFAYLTATMAIAESLVSSWGPSDLPVDYSEVVDGWVAAYTRLRVSLAGDENLESAKRAESLSQKWSTLQSRLGTENQHDVTAFE